MRVTAQDVFAAWVERDSESPYHVEQQPIGHDRKQHEGPLPTNEQFPNTWLPTQQEPEQLEVVQIKVVQIGARKTADADVAPGISSALFRAWEQAHDEGLAFYASSRLEDLERFLHYLTQFAFEVARKGLRINQEDMTNLQNYAIKHPPDHGMGQYSPMMTNKITDTLDTVLQRLHGEAARLSGTTREDWYAVQKERENNLLHNRTQVMQLSPEEERELGIQNKVTPDQLRKERGPMAPFLEDAWQRKKRQETVGMKITAADVLPLDPSKRRLKTLGPRKGPLPAGTPPAAPAHELKPLQRTILTPSPTTDFDDDGADAEDMGDYEGLLYMYDTAATGLNDIARALMEVQPTLDPQKQKEAGAIIAKLRGAIRALSA
jgi:hypothetical protein